MITEQLHPPFNVPVPTPTPVGVPVSVVPIIKPVPMSIPASAPASDPEKNIQKQLFEDFLNDEKQTTFLSNKIEINFGKGGGDRLEKNKIFLKFLFELHPEFIDYMNFDGLTLEDQFKTFKQNRIKSLTENLAKKIEETKGAQKLSDMLIIGDPVELAKPSKTELDEPQLPKLVLDDLNTDQRFIYDSIVENHDKKGIHSITGSAGVGKSTLVSFIVDALYKYGNICVVSPTHQALKVLKNMLEQRLSYSKINDITFKTVASYLQMKYTIDDEGNEIFVQSNDPRLEKVYCDYLFIDESSMIAKEHSEMIMNNFNVTVSRQIIFIGDQYQLKPVKGEVNPIFDPKYVREEGHLNRFRLNKVTRQAEGNPIINIAQYIRTIIEDLSLFNEREFFWKLLDEHGGMHPEVRVVNDSNDFLWYYLNEDRENDPNLTKKVIASYTNKAVNWFNGYARYNLVGEKYKNENGIIEIPQVIPDETVIFLNPYTGGVGQEIIFQTGDQVVITEVTEKFNVAHDLRYFHCKTDTFNFNVLDIRDKEKYIIELDKLKEIAVSLQSSSDARAKRSAWGNYYTFKNKYALIRPVYSNTIHKLQGSTYDHTFINMPEIRPYLYKGLDDALRLIYVALTRGKKVTILRG